MNNLTWVIENFAKEPSYKELQDAVKELGYDLIVINGDYSKNQVSRQITSGKVIVNGSIEMCKLIEQDLKDNTSCELFCAINFTKYKCSCYYSYFGDKLFNDVYAIISLSELKRRLFYYYGLFGKEALIFIRPDSGEKTFQAQTLDIIDFKDFYETNKHLEHELVVISTPKKVLAEWRIVVSKTDIIDYSLYRYQDQVSKIHACPPNVLDFAREVISMGYHPNEVYCVDVFLGYDNVPYLGEITSFSSCGLYASNKLNIARVVSKLALDFKL